ncbi:STAS domain-containing protein [Nocardioides panacis]|uniref:STAS domain-containing protein n=1 Tax=Nocardioides panacis TaxID=2849501 RepID=A0A975T0T4_9ACTN|nr:STAS domain-containing protein [Nocardioides panacis]QWZ09406.1 STAS domain-containing protein [Nocardioides panacis]
MTMNKNRSPDGYALHDQPGVTTTHPPVLSLSVDRPCGWSVLAASGEMDTACAGVLRSLLSAAGPNVVVDLREVTFMDASGLGVLATSGHIARRLGGAVRLVGPSHQVRRVLSLTLLDRVLPIYDDLQEALTAA